MIFKACAIALISVFVIAVLKEIGLRSVGAISAICAAVIFSLASELLFDGVGTIKEISQIAGVAKETADILKVIGVGYVFGFCSDVCAELGDAGTASALTLVGRLEVVGIALPYFKRLIDLGVSLL